MADASDGSDGACSDASSSLTCEDFACIPRPDKKERPPVQKTPAAARNSCRTLKCLVEGAEQSRTLGGGAVAVGCCGLEGSSIRRRIRALFRSSTSLLRSDPSRPMEARLPIVMSLGLTRVLKRRGGAEGQPHEEKGARKAAVVVEQKLSQLRYAEDLKLAAQVDEGFRDLNKRAESHLRSLVDRDDPAKAHVVTKADASQAADYHAQGVEARRIGKHEAALVAFRRALEVRLKVSGPNSPSTATARSFLATAQRDLGDYNGALKELRIALEVQHKALGEYHSHVAVTRSNIGALLKCQGRPDLAVPEHRVALEILLRQPVESAATLAEVHEHIAHSLRLVGDVRAAAESFRAALQIRRRMSGEDDPRVLRLIRKAEELETGFAPPRCLHVQITDEEEEAKRGKWTCICRYRLPPVAPVCPQCGYRRPLPSESVTQVFSGFVFVFTGVFPKCIHPSAWQEWKWAEQRGAVVKQEVTDSVTHVIHRTGYRNSLKVHQAEEIGGIHVVPYDWFVESINTNHAFDPDIFLLRKRLCTDNALPVDRTPGDRRSAVRRSYSTPPGVCRFRPPEPTTLCPPLPEPKPLRADAASTVAASTIPPVTPVAWRPKPGTASSPLTMGGVISSQSGRSGSPASCSTEPDSPFAQRKPDVAIEGVQMRTLRDGEFEKKVSKADELQIWTGSGESPNRLWVLSPGAVSPVYSSACLSPRMPGGPRKVGGENSAFSKANLVTPRALRSKGNVVSLPPVVLPVSISRSNSREVAKEKERKLAEEDKADEHRQKPTGTDEP